MICCGFSLLLPLCFSSPADRVAEALGGIGERPIVSPMLIIFSNTQSKRATRPTFLPLPGELDAATVRRQFWVCPPCVLRGDLSRATRSQIQLSALLRCWLVWKHTLSVCVFRCFQFELTSNQCAFMD